MKSELETYRHIITKRELVNGMSDIHTRRYLGQSMMRNQIINTARDDIDMTLNFGHCYKAFNTATLFDACIPFLDKIIISTLE